MLWLKSDCKWVQSSSTCDDNFTSSSKSTGSEGSILRCNWGGEVTVKLDISVKYTKLWFLFLPRKLWREYLNISFFSNGLLFSDFPLPPNILYQVFYELKQNRQNLHSPIPQTRYHRSWASRFPFSLTHWWGMAVIYFLKISVHLF